MFDALVIMKKKCVAFIIIHLIQIKEKKKNLGVIG